MNPKIKKWLPFIILILIIIVTAFYLFLNTLKSTYVPTTDNPGQIYREACSGCHGVQGEGKGLFPNLADQTIEAAHVREIIKSGALMMPSFEQLQGDTLNKVAEYVSQHKFSE